MEKQIIKDNTLYEIYNIGEKITLEIKSPKVKEIIETYRNIDEIIGLEICKGLVTLDVTGNKLKTLDLSNNTKITELYCSNNELESLNLDGFKSLEILKCYNNKITNLNIKNCKSLSKLNCRKNNLENLDLSGCKKLNLENEIDITVDIDKNVNVACSHYTKPIFRMNSTSDVEIEEIEGKRVCKIINTKVTRLVIENCDIDQIVGLNRCSDLIQLLISDNNLSNLDLTFCPQLRTVLCKNNKLKWLRLPESINVVDCSFNQIETLDLTSNNYLRVLVANENNIENIKVPNCAELGKLEINSNKLAQIDLSNCIRLMTLLANNNKLVELNLVNNRELKQLSLKSNPISKIIFNRKKDVPNHSFDSDWKLEIV